jgi:hypothetical protein
VLFPEELFAELLPEPICVPENRSRSQLGILH